MHKVITINLNGQVYQLDERGYEALRAYLELAEGQLGTNPDKTEIIRDLEQSVAEKFTRHLDSGRTVVATADVEQVLLEIGPVDGGAPNVGQPGTPGGAANAPAAKRLYQIREGAMLSGLCNGIAAYLQPRSDVRQDRVRGRGDRRNRRVRPSARDGCRSLRNSRVHGALREDLVRARSGLRGVRVDTWQSAAQCRACEGHVWWSAPQRALMKSARKAD